MRLFHGLIFQGAGKTSVTQLRRLNNIYQRAGMIAGGLQQGVHTDSQEHKDGTVEIEDAVRDIAAALLGRDITFTKVLPYPPVPENLTPMQESE